MKVPTRPQRLSEPPVPEPAMACRSHRKPWSGPWQSGSGPAWSVWPLAGGAAFCPPRPSENVAESRHRTGFQQPNAYLSDINIYTDVRALPLLTCLRPKTALKIRPSGQRSHLVPVALAFLLLSHEGNNQRIEISALQSCVSSKFP